jgi:chromosome segregation ATPase
VYWDEEDEDLTAQAKLAPRAPNDEATGAALEASGLGELEQLRAENVDLRQVITELQQFVEEAHRAEQSWVEQQKEYENLLEEKSEVIRGLHQRLKGLEEQVQVRPPPGEEELMALSDELERERCKLQQERRQLDEEMAQLREDEETVMKQMREMEVSMSRDRAELARQRSELQRLHAEIRHELELAVRDAALRERLIPLQRRHQEMLQRKGGAEPAPENTPAQPQPAASPPAAALAKKDSGLLRRLFRPGK